MKQIPKPVIQSGAIRQKIKIKTRRKKWIRIEGSEKVVSAEWEADARRRAAANSKNSIKVIIFPMHLNQLYHPLQIHFQIFFLKNKNKNQSLTANIKLVGNRTTPTRRRRQARNHEKTPARSRTDGGAAPSYYTVCVT